MDYGTHESFKVIANGKELSFPILRLMAFLGCGFILGVISCWAYWSGPSMAVLVEDMAYSFLVGSFCTIGALIILNGRK